VLFICEATNLVWVLFFYEAIRIIGEICDRHFVVYIEYSSDGVDFEGFVGWICGWGFLVVVVFWGGGALDVVGFGGGVFLRQKKTVFG
jgi:hypothetical protein